MWRLPNGGSGRKSTPCFSGRTNLKGQCPLDAGADGWSFSCSGGCDDFEKEE
jgi:hypothetical protein